MGDKISQLPAAVSVDGTELVPIVQGGATKSVTGAILRSPTGSAGGDLAGSYPNPTLTAVTTAQSNVGSQSAIPVLTVDAKGRVVALSTVSNPALTTVQIAGLSTAAGAALATAGAVGLSTFAARADHQHARPTAAEVGALGATAAAGGDLAGNFPNPVLASITTAQSNVGSITAIPVISTDAKGRVTALSSVQFSALTTVQIAGLSTVAPATLATSAVVGLSQFAARADHQHVFPTAAQVGALGATAAASGDLVGNYPNPALATITTAQSNVGSSTVVPVLSIDAKGRVTALGSTPISGSAGGTVTSITAGTGLSGGTITSSGTIDITAVTTAQSNVGSASQIPVLSINAQGQVTALSSVAASGGAALSTNAPAALATAAFAGLSTEASRSDHQHLFPTAAQVGALGATAVAGGDLAGNFPSPTLASVTTAQTGVGSGLVIPVLTIDAKGRVTSLTTAANSALTTNQIAGLSITAPAALATSAVVGLSTFVARADHQHVFPTAAQVGALGATAAAGGDLVGNFPSPTLAAVTTAQSNVGSGLAIPVISTDAKGRVIALTTVACPALTTTQIAGLSTVAPAALATAGVIGLSTFAARADHQHVFPTAAEVNALGATASASGDLAGNYPGPTLAAITTAQSNVGSSTIVPVLSIDAKGRVTSLSTAAISSASTSAITALTGDVIATGPGAVSAALATITTAQSNVGSSTQIPVLSIDAQGRVTALSSIAATSGAALTTAAPADLAITATVGIGTTAARADHVHAIPRIISVADASDGIRITQTGSGLAIRVEDETNPDTSPFAVTNTGNVGIGTDNPTALNGSVSKVLSLVGASNLVLGFTNTTVNRGAIFEFSRTGRTPSTGYAQISALPDGTDGGNLQFFTAPVSGVNVDRLNISPTGNVGIGVALGNATQKLDVAGAVKANLFIDALVTATIAAAYTVNVANGSTVSLTLTSATPATITLPTPVTGQSFDVFVKQPASGTPTTVAWSASPSIRWAGGNPPVITAVLGKADLISFKTDGTTWFGSYVQNF
jgi:hypothetical protein